MGGFLEDILTSTFDPNYGWLGRPASGALRSGIDIARSLPRQLEPLFSPFAWRYGPQLEKGEGLESPEITNVLDEYLGSGIESKLLHEPVQQMAENALGVKYPEGITAGELARAALLPDLGPGDLPERRTIPTPYSEEVVTAPTDVDKELWTRHQLGGALESGVNLVGALPMFMAAPEAIGPAYMPGMLESLIAELKSGEYGKAGVTGLALGGAGLGTAGKLGRGLLPERAGKFEPVAESTVSMRFERPNLDPQRLGESLETYERRISDPNWRAKEEYENLGAEDEFGLREEVPPESVMFPRTRELVSPQDRADLDRVKFIDEDIARIDERLKEIGEPVKPELSFDYENQEAPKNYALPGETGQKPIDIFREKQHNMVEAAVDKIKNRAADIIGNEAVRDIKLERDNYTYYDPETNTLHYASVDIVNEPNTIIHELAHANALHQFPGVSRTYERSDLGDSFGPVERGYTPIGEGKIAEVDPSLVEHTTENIGERAKYAPDEHLFQTSFESLKNDPEIGEISRQFQENIKKPQEEFWDDMGDIPLRGRPPKEISAPERESKEWRVTFNDGTTKFIKAPDRGEAGRIAREEGIPEGASKIAGISEKTSDMKEGEVRKDIRQNETTFVATMSDGSTRKGRAYSPESFKRTVEAAQKAGDTGLTVKDVTEREPTKGRGVVPKRKGEALTPEEVHAIGKVLGEKKGEAEELTQAREAVIEAITGKKIEKPSTTVTKVIKEKTPKKEETKSEFEEIPEEPKAGEEEAPKKNYKVTLSSGEEHVIKATSPEQAREHAEGVLQEHGSSKTVDKVEEHYTGLEKSAREEIDVTKKGKEAASEEVKTLKEKESFTVKLSNGKETTVRANDEATARKIVEDRIKEKGRKVEVKSVEKTPSPLDRAIDYEPGTAEEAVRRLEKGLIDDITDIPKTLKFAFDVSWPGRQGLFLLNRPQALEGMWKGSKTIVPFKGREWHLKIQDELANRPNAALYKEAGLNQYKYDPTEITKISERAEEIPSERAAQLPGIRHSTRAFEDAANLARANMFDYYAKKFQERGQTFENNPELYKGMADYLNVLTMRKPLPEKLQSAAWILNKLYVSPMAVYSRLQMVYPPWYAKIPKELRLEAARDIGGTIGSLALLMGAVKIAAAQAGYDEDEVDFIVNPTHTDFGKLKIGHTYHDDFSGLLQPVRLISRLVAGTKISRGGKKSRIPGSIGDYMGWADKELPATSTAKDEIDRFFEYKKSPIYQAYKGITTGKDWYGENYGAASLLMDLFAPLSVEDPIEAMRYYGPGEALQQAPGVFGGGTMLEFPDENEEEYGGLEYPF